MSGAQSTEELQDLLASIAELAAHISALDRPSGLPPPGATLPPPVGPPTFLNISFPIIVLAAGCEHQRCLLHRC